MSGEEWPAEYAETLTSLAVGMVDLVAIFDRTAPPLRVAFATGETQRLLGVPPSALTDPELLEELLDLDDVDFLSAACSSRPIGEVFDALVTWFDPDGEASPMIHRCVVRTNAAGQRVLVTVGHLLTGVSADRTLANATVSRVSDELDDDAARVVPRERALLRHAADAVLELDADGLLRWASHAITSLAGWDPGLVVGRPLTTLVHGDDEATLVQFLTDAMDGRPARFRGRLRTERGTYVWLEATGRRLEPSADRADAGVVAVLRDVDEDVASRGVLEDERHRFASMFAHHDAIMLLVDPMSGDIVEANEAACRFYGYDHARITAMRITEINTLPPDEVRARMRSAAVSHRNAFVFPHRLADGRIRQVEVHSSPIEDRSGMLLFSIVRDVTDDVAVRQALTDLLGS